MMHRFLNVLRAARVQLVDDTGSVQRLQVFEGSLGAFGGQRVIDKVISIAHFGLVSVPPIDSEVVLASPAGDRTQTIALGSNHQPSRPKGLKPGDSGLYDVRGLKITLTADGIVIDGGETNLPVTVRNVPSLRVEAAQIECTGDVVAVCDGERISLRDLHSAYNEHHHIGVQAGSQVSGRTDYPA